MKSKTLTIRLSADELAAIEAAAKLAGVSVAELVRRDVFRARGIPARSADRKNGRAQESAPGNEAANYDLFPWVNPVYIKNQENFPQEELDKYRGQYIAWSFDGDRIVASGFDQDELDRNLNNAGQDPCRVIIHYIDDM